MTRSRVRRSGPARNCRNDAHDLAGLDHGVGAVQEANVLVGDEHVDEPAQLPGVVEQALTETRELAFETLQDVFDGRTFDLHLGLTARKVAQLRRDANGGHDFWFSSISKASWNASRVGVIVAVGPQVGDTASS